MCFVVWVLGKVPLTFGNKGSLESFLHMVAITTRLIKTLSSPGCTVRQNNNIYTLLWQYFICLCLIYRKGAFDLWKRPYLKCVWLYGLYMVAMTMPKGNERGQRTRVENRIYFGMHCVGKQCLDNTMATWYNNILLRMTYSVSGDTGKFLKDRNTLQEHPCLKSITKLVDSLDSLLESIVAILITFP